MYRKNQRCRENNNKTLGMRGTLQCCCCCCKLKLKEQFKEEFGTNRSPRKCSLLDLLFVTIFHGRLSGWI